MLSVIFINSTANPQLARENQEIVARLLGLNVNEARELLARGVPPLRMVIQKMFGASPVVRRSARYFLGRWIVNAFGMIGGDGALILKGHRIGQPVRVPRRF